jgi:hypothetical protein
MTRRLLLVSTLPFLALGSALARAQGQGGSAGSIRLASAVATGLVPQIERGEGKRSAPPQWFSDRLGWPAPAGLRQ